MKQLKSHLLYIMGVHNLQWFSFYPPALTHFIYDNRQKQLEKNKITHKKHKIKFQHSYDNYNALLVSQTE